MHFIKALAMCSSGVGVWGFRLPSVRMASFFTGPRQAQIEQRLVEAFAPKHLEVINTSHGRKEDESHFKVVVVSEVFDGQRLVGRHRAINSAVSESDGKLAFHSLEIAAAKTPAEWELNDTVAPSPKCKGGDGRGMML
mmetsp:Transcript_19567/g.32637  ORF Transcript_19567/g.32637 Transcript_19567/m.32637 type:complete len:138 (+) Transcript_19567:34-447(+)